MPQFTVVTAQKVKDVQGKYGAMQVIAMKLNDGTMTTDAEWFTKADTPIPFAGESVEFEIDASNPQFPPKAKKPNNGNYPPSGGGGGGFKKDPATQRSIIRQHSQEMALRYVVAKEMVLTKGIADLLPIIDWFEKDASGTEPQTLEQAVAALPVDEPVLVGATDDSIPF